MATVRYYGQMAQTLGIKEEQLEGKTVSQVLNQFKKIHGTDLYKEAKRCHILVDHSNAGTEKGFRTPVKPDGLVEIVPVCGGG